MGNRDVNPHRPELHPPFLQQAPNSSANSRTSSASASQHETSTSPPPQVSEKSPVQQPSPQTRTITPLDSQPPTPPETEPDSRRTSKMYTATDPWAHRDNREPRDLQLREYAHSCDSREGIPKTREYPRTPPTEWKSYVQRRMQYGSSVDMDPDCLPEVQHHRQKQQIEEDEVDEAYWSSVSMLYEKIPSCTRPRPVRVPRLLEPLDSLFPVPQLHPTYFVERCFPSFPL